MEDLIQIVGAKQGAWSIEQLADLLECSPNLLRKLVRQGRLPAFKIGSLIRLNPKTTAEWLRTRMTVQPRK